MHRVAALVKRWLLGTHQSGIDHAHLQAYLGEFVFRFNRRTSKARGLLFYRVLELAVAHDPVRYTDLVADPQAQAGPTATAGRRPAPAQSWPAPGIPTLARDVQIGPFS